MPTDINDTTLYELYPQDAFELADSLNIQRSLTVKERDAIDDSDFAWPDAPGGKPLYPADTQDHLDSLATLIGRAPKDKQGEIKSRAIRIAKKNNLTLPDSWKEDDSSDGSDGSRTDTPDITRDAMPTETQLYLPIVRTDREKREVIVRATAEVLDGYGTVFDFEGSKDAFSRWRGNIREMHDPTKAVGRSINWEPVPGEKAIDVALRISKGAEDTWLKVLDGTLSGASVGAKNGKWGKREYNGQMVPVLERYDMVELSLVDNPATPGCDIKIVRASGVDEQFEACDVLDFTEEETPPTTRTETPTDTRVGATLSAATRTKMHSTRDSMANTLRQHLDNCGCDECNGIAKALDPDMDGDIDIIPSLDTDNDGGGASGDGSGDGESRALRTLITRIITEVLTEQIKQNLTPVTARMNGIAARFAQVTFDTPPQTQENPDITRRLEAVEHMKTELGEVRSLLSEVKGVVTQIAAQPQAGGPMVNSALMRQQVAQEMALQQQQPKPPETHPVWQLAEYARKNGLTKTDAIDAGMDILHGLAR